MDRYTMLDALGVKFINEEISLDTYDKLVKKIMEYEIINEKISLDTNNRLKKKTKNMDVINKIVQQPSSIHDTNQDKLNEMQLIDTYIEQHLNETSFGIPFKASKINLSKQKYFLTNLKKINTRLQNPGELSPDHVKRLKTAREKIKGILTKFQEELNK